MHLSSLPFWNGSCADLLRELESKGGFLVAPSAPSLCQAADDPALWDAHLAADFAVMDSGFLELLLRLRTGKRGNRISGHQVIEHLLFDPHKAVVPSRSQPILWVVPDEAERERISSYLNKRGFPGSLQRFYVAPIYATDPDFEDSALLHLCREWNPRWIVLCIGGGRQEKLGAFLRRGFDRQPAILATGAAIAFFTGGQAKIPRWADRLYLGWFLRTLHDPKKILPRYLAALRLPAIVWTQGK